MSPFWLQSTIYGGGFDMDFKKRVDRFSIFIAVIWVTALTVSMFYNINNISQKQEHLILEHAKNAFEKDLMFREWVAMHGGVYVYPTEKTPPNPYLSHIEDRDIYTKDGEMLTLMNPAYTLRELMENFSGMYGEKGHITSLKLLNPNNKPDDWEIKALTKFETQNINEFYEIYNYKGSEHLRYMRALSVKPECLKCHAHQDYKIGDTRGGVSITIPMEKYNRDGIVEKLNIVYIHMMILIISLIIGFLIYKKIVGILIRDEKVREELGHKEKLLQEQAKMVAMGEMIGNIAHQWRQPLTVISTGATGIQIEKEMNTLTDEFLDETCKMINLNAQYLSKTIDDFQDFIKGDRKKELFNLEKNITSFLILVKGAVKNHNLELNVNIEPDIELESYPNELIQCYINIFNNAKDELKKTDDRRRIIFIDAYKEDSYVVILFKDNAGGIAEDIISRVFEPYFTTKHQSKGTGIGLHMTYNIVVDGLGGTIEAINESFEFEGVQYKGAVFILKIPISLNQTIKEKKDKIV